MRRLFSSHKAGKLPDQCGSGKEVNIEYFRGFISMQDT